MQSPGRVTASIGVARSRPATFRRSGRRRWERFVVNVKVARVLPHMIRLLRCLILVRHRRLAMYAETRSVLCVVERVSSHSAVPVGWS